MSRDIENAVSSASQEELVRTVVLVSLDFEEVVSRMTSAPFDIVYEGNVYRGVGNLGQISAIKEATELEASGITLTLSGVDPANISAALNYHYQGRKATIYLALLDENHAVIGEPVVLFTGRMDNQTVTLGAQGTISIAVENPLADWQRARERRYNNEDQQSRYPGDKGLQYAEQAVRKEIKWGQ